YNDVRAGVGDEGLSVRLQSSVATAPIKAHAASGVPHINNEQYCSTSFNSPIEPRFAMSVPPRHAAESSRQKAVGSWRSTGKLLDFGSREGEEGSLEYRLMVFD